MCTFHQLKQIKKLYLEILAEIHPGMKNVMCTFHQLKQIKKLHLEISAEIDPGVTILLLVSLFVFLCFFYMLFYFFFFMCCLTVYTQPHAQYAYSYTVLHSLLTNAQPTQMQPCYTVYKDSMDSSILQLVFNRQFLLYS